MPRHAGFPRVVHARRTRLAVLGLVGVAALALATRSCRAQSVVGGAVAAASRSASARRAAAALNASTAAAATAVADALSGKVAVSGKASSDSATHVQVLQVGQLCEGSTGASPTLHRMLAARAHC